VCSVMDKVRCRGLLTGRDTLDTTTTSETADSGLGDTLDVVTKNLAVALGSALSKTLSSLSAYSKKSAHCSLKVEEQSRRRSEGILTSGHFVECCLEVDVVEDLGCRSVILAGVESLGNWLMSESSKRAGKKAYIERRYPRLGRTGILHQPAKPLHRSLRSSAWVDVRVVVSPLQGRQSSSSASERGRQGFPMRAMWAIRRGVRDPHLCTKEKERENE
jgi:hypothetical protein